MSYDVIALLVGWLVAMAIFFGFIALLRYIQYREHIALLKHGINPQERIRNKKSRGILRAGLITMMVGFTLMIGLYPIGFFLPSALSTPLHLGPWLLPGLIPFGVGLALIGSYYLESNSAGNGEEDPERRNIIQMKKHQDKERRERDQS